MLLQSGRINGTLPRRRTSLVAGLEQGSLRLQIARSYDRVAAETWI
ncbi:Unknown protein sequence [Pseudomonas amygdali pv. morsprunorum]|nr:Unknown protein sequence [Pseudomonas amygdali pv. morsprunorum]